MKTTLAEADVEQAALEWLWGLDLQVLHGLDIAPDMPNAEREDNGQVVLERKRRDLSSISLNSSINPVKVNAKSSENRYFFR